jgi:creatinine amidohydrolase/Fe(II)-dependent formamide hydrolase-like protein
MAAKRAKKKRGGGDSGGRATHAAKKARGRRRRPADPLRSLQVWDRLEVGPVEVQRRRIVAPYRITHGGRSEAIDLIYRYEEPAFDPRFPGAANLGSMIAAQVALNYGLFCRELVFNGSYDARDRDFIRRYASHTAREIYVIKLLRENPFLRGPVRELPAVRRDDYLLADLRFEGDPLADNAVSPFAAFGDDTRSRYAVLSSGGKDSLLSYGLLRELGYEPHSIFINESGRHWFTALNAYRHLRDTDPKTARVWTNADRVFTWMLRRMPFIRKDFADLRADIYPIRLWTVAVFLFGALPLMASRRLGRLVIGDEFDTTVRGSFRGITHYGGLFDQSRHFDNALSRYFGAKRWNVTQFSVVRPASELLIVKTLAERYPELQAHQVSCHATHGEQGRMLPCGKCEKCRRVVAMLTAVGADPKRCGYTTEQVADCLASLVEQPLHQESAGAEHLTWMLEKAGSLPGSQGAHPARRHPEVLKLRFDAEHSPLDSIPADLRQRLWPLLLEHADGAVEKKGGAWRRCDPLSRRALAAPYRYDLPVAKARASTRREAAARRARAKGGDGRDVLLELLTWPEAERRLAEVDIALLPVGATEQHGPHLTLDTDAYDAARLARDVAEACSDPKPVVLPLIPYGVSYHHESFAGTISITPEALARMVHDIGMSAARNGIKKLVIINGHGGNIPTLHFAAQTINAEAQIFTCVDTGETSDADVYALTQTPNDVHAGEVETSTSLYLRPDTVQMDKAQRYVPRFSNPYLDFTSRLSVGWYGRTHKISRTGVMGDPTVATGEKGAKMWSLMVDHLVRLVEDLKRLTLEQIHQTKL